jgi:hypothetical protein
MAPVRNPCAAGPAAWYRRSSLRAGHVLEMKCRVRAGGLVTQWVREMATAGNGGR